MAIEIRSVKVGRERTNCYVLMTDGVAMVIDPGAEPEKVIGLIPESVRLKCILLTHGHFDHVEGVDGILAKYPGIPVMLHENDIVLYDEVPEQGLFVGELLRQPRAELEAVSDGEYIPFGEYDIEVIATPGHTPGGVCFLVDKYLFTGDTLFYHTVGRTDLPFSNEGDMKISLDRLAHLDGSLVVYPGHGRSSTIAEEKENNPYIK